LKDHPGRPYFWYSGGRPGYHAATRDYCCKDLFGDKKFTEYFNGLEANMMINKKLRDSEIMIVDLNFYHPQMIRNASFQYDNYIKQTIKSRVKRIHDGYDMDIFINLGDVNYLSNPICNLFLYIIEKNLI
jgi:hypothetical protein